MRAILENKEGDNMEIKEVKQKKNELRQGVKSLLDEFSRETGLKVEEIKVINICCVGIHLGQTAYAHSVQVRVEV